MHLVHTMAYTKETPWHGLGNRLGPDQPLAVWAKSAGMDWRIEESEVRFVSDDASDAKGLGTIHAFPHQKVLYRSDTKAPLSVVSKRYQVVQPGEVLEFYRDLTEVGGFELETAGVLKEGRKFWALARTGQSATLKGRDDVHGYLLLATACDGTLATIAQFTSIRVVCNNTLAIALGQGQGAIKVPHRSEFNAQAVKRQLGVAISSWDGFMTRMKALSECKVSREQADAYFKRVLTYTSTTTCAHGIDATGAIGATGTRTNDSLERITAVNGHALRAVQRLYAGQGRGSELTSAAGTAWGLVNSVTEFIDHHRRARSDDHRLDAAWFGAGAVLKQRAWEEANKLIA